MQLVVLAAGRGQRFGGLKQLAAVGPNGEVIMDYTVAAAYRCGYESVVVIVREEIREEIASHIRRCWPSELPVELVCQPPVPGTAQAVYAARPAIHGPFGVANADDLYGDHAIGALMGHFEPDGVSEAPSDAQRHVLVAYGLSHTVLNNRPLTRGLCEVDEDQRLTAIAEHVVSLREDGQFDCRPLPSNDPHAARHLEELAPKVLAGDELTSMNLWGFHPRMLEHLGTALEHFDLETAARELLLPDVVGKVVASAEDEVQVTTTTSRCIGLTSRDDLAVVREELGFAAARAATGSPETAPAI
ncbi:MAG TPA: NTP transferase domain-containing protein [Acidimicrobiales bacterium]|nr:NTP transferase domain-containing protein [Acidimicrobiales bacterium]